MSWEGQGFPQAGRTVPQDFPWDLPLGNPSEQCCHTLDNLVLSSPLLIFTQSLAHQRSSRQDVGGLG